MKNKERKERCPECGKILGTFIETGNDGGNRIRLTRYYCESCGTYDEKDVVMSVIAKKISPAKLLEEKIRKEMLDLGISDNKAADKARQIADEARLEKLDRWF